TSNPAARSQSMQKSMRWAAGPVTPADGEVTPTRSPRLRGAGKRSMRSIVPAQDPLLGLVRVVGRDAHEYDSPSSLAVWRRLDVVPDARAARHLELPLLVGLPGTG